MKLIYTCNYVDVKIRFRELLNVIVILKFGWDNLFICSLKNRIIPPLTTKHGVLMLEKEKRGAVNNSPLENGFMR